MYVSLYAYRLLAKSLQNMHRVSLPFQERTLVGGRSAKREQDIQLHGLGILPEHCVITIEESGLYMTPLNGARCFVNGTQVVNKTLLQHGDRIVWGNHHFFRVNCPRSATGTTQFIYIRNILILIY